MRWFLVVAVFIVIVGALAWLVAGIDSCQPAQQQEQLEWSAECAGLPG